MNAETRVETWDSLFEDNTSWTDIIVHTIFPWYKRVWWTIKYGSDWPYLYAHGYTKKELEIAIKVDNLSNNYAKADLDEFRKNF